MESLYGHIEWESMGDIVAERNETARIADERRQIQHQRRFAAAKVSSLNTGWATRPVVANWDVKQDIQSLRARAREAVQNNGHFKRHLGRIRQNVVGQKGLQLQCRAMMPNKRGGKQRLNQPLNSAVELAFWKWSTNPAFASVSGRMNFKRIQKLAITQLKKDGEILARIEKADNPFGMSIRMLNCDYLDEMYNEIRPDGNRVIMSIEIDANWKPVAYHLTTPTSNITFAPDRERKRIRVPAEEIIHAFYVVDDEEQVRGITSFHAAMVSAKHLHGYAEAAIVGARVGAMQTMVIEEDLPTTDIENDPRVACYENKTAEEVAAMRFSPKIDLDNGSVTRLPVGMKVAQYKPDQPNQNHPEFYKSLFMDEATALETMYYALSGDMSSVNFSTARFGREEEKEVWKDDQDFLADFFCTPIFHAWLKSAWLHGAITLSAREFDDLQFPNWRGRGWAYIEPAKDIEATKNAIASGLQTWSGAVEDQGDDPEERLETMLRDNERFEKYGIELSFDDKAEPTADEDENGNQSTLDDIEVVNRRANAYGVGVRAGALTPQTDDEEDFRKALALPGMSADAKRAWDEDKGVRRPITLVSSDGTHPGANPATDDTDTSNDDEPTDKKKKDKGGGAD